MRLSASTGRQPGILSGFSFIIAPANPVLAAVVECAGGSVLGDSQKYPRPGSAAAARCLIISAKAEGWSHKDALRCQVSNQHAGLQGPGAKSHGCITHTPLLGLAVAAWVHVCCFNVLKSRSAPAA